MDAYIASHKEELKKLLVTLAQIPAPSLSEQQRARFCRDWLIAKGVTVTYIDDVNNVIIPFGNVDGDLTVIAAHSDVVFPDQTPLPLTERNGRVYCPGIGDDTANVAVLMMAAAYLCENCATPRNGGVLLVITAAEEGLGNLKGSGTIATAYGDRVTEFIALDCHADELINGAVGSIRYHITARTSGGHSYFDFGQENAIAVLSSLIHTLYTLPLPENTHTTYNVGTVHGGTSVNAIAQSAEMLFEFRSDSGEALRLMHHQLNEVIRALNNDRVTVEVSVLGERPCAGAVDPIAEQMLVERVAAAIESRFFKAPVIKDGSTDCNSFLARGIPSVCFGCVRGAGMHTREEYIELDSLDAGLATALDVILYYFF